MTIEEQNDSTAIYIANVTSTSEPFFGNATVGVFENVTTNNKQPRDIKVSINNTMHIWTRGKYNSTGGGKIQGIIVKNNSYAITDLAGNPLDNLTGVVDIYDGAITITANATGGTSWTGFSIPHDVDSRATWDALDGTLDGESYTPVVYTHDGTQWVQATSTSNDLIPLRGYLVRITGIDGNDSVDIPFQTDLEGNPSQSELSLYTTSVSINDGAYSLVGINGYLDNDAITDITATGEHLFSITDGGSNVVGSIVYADEVSTDIGTPTVFLANKLNPYRAYWIWSNGNSQSASYTFNGYANQNLI